MIAPIRTECLQHDAEWNPDNFSAMLEPIRRQASIAFRYCRSEAREELIQEVIANSYCAQGSAGQTGTRRRCVSHSARAICDPAKFLRWTQSRLPAEHTRSIVSFCSPDSRFYHRTA